MSPIQTAMYSARKVFALEYLKFFLTDKSGRVQWTIDNLCALVGGYGSANIYKSIRQGVPNPDIDSAMWEKLLQQLLVDLVEAENKSVLNFRQPRGLSIYNTTISCGMLPIVKYLLTKSVVQVNDCIEDHNGYTALHMAIQREDLELVEYLLSIPSIDVMLKTKVRLLESNEVIYLSLICTPCLLYIERAIAPRSHRRAFVTKLQL